MTSPADAPWLDRTVSRLAGNILVWLARRAKRRGDQHQFDHYRAAGNSAPCAHEGRCRLGWPNTEGIVR